MARTTSSGSTSVGYETLGKVNTDCKYHWTRYQWGVLNRGRRRVPAGARHPLHHSGRRRRVILRARQEQKQTVAQGAPRLTELRARRPDGRPRPRHHIGRGRRYRSEAKATSFTPHRRRRGIRARAASVTSPPRFQDSSGPWTSRGAICRPEGRSGLRKLRWDLSEKALEPDQPHQHEYKTAFAFEHSRRPRLHAQLRPRAA
ncbi:hypothetical protein RB593_009989 [Gaeumannomyces tritici]